MHAIRIFHISRIITPPIRFFPNTVASERKECERHSQTEGGAAGEAAAAVASSPDVLHTHGTKTGHLTFPSRRPWQVAATRQSARLTPAVRPRPR